MSRSFEPHPQFRLLRAAIDVPQAVVRRLAGPPIVVDGAELDPWVQYMLWLRDRSPQPRWSAPGLSLPQRRAMSDREARLGMPLAKGVVVTQAALDGPSGPLRIRIYRGARTASEPPILLFLHGGGWSIGSLDGYEGPVRMLARITGAVVVSLHYRLAPEHPFPAAVADAVAAYDWAMQASGQLGARAGRVAVMGDSAGGNLAAVLSTVLRDRGTGPVPLAQGLLYPVTDLTFSQPSHEQFGEGFFLTAQEMHWFRGQYVPESAQWQDPMVSPLLAQRHDGLPPTMIWTAGFDVLRDEGEAYGRALAEAGQDVEVRQEASMIHGFFNMGMIPGGMERAARVCREMGSLLHRSSRE